MPLARLQRIEAFKRGEAVLQVRRIADPPSPADFASLRLEASEVADLRKCRPGHCDMKLDRAGLERLQRSAAGDVAGEYRAHLAAYAAGYAARGNAALMIYAQASHPEPIVESLRALRDAHPLYQSVACRHFWRRVRRGEAQPRAIARSSGAERNMQRLRERLERE
jgi:hypothetical protein